MPAPSNFLVAACLAALPALAHAQCAQPQGNAALAASTSPYVGTPLALQLTAAPGAPFVVTLDLDPGPLVFPWGTLCQGGLLLPVLQGTLPAGSGRASSWLPIPNDTAWAGITLHLQALVADVTAPNQFLALSNAQARTLQARPASPWTWASGPSPAESFFPLGVWLQHPSRAQKYRDEMGINTFVELWQGATEAKLETLVAENMPVYVTPDAGARSSPNSQIIHAWNHQDEPDNAQSNGMGGYDPCIDPVVIQQLYQQWKALDPDRPVFLNLGQGVANLNYPGRGTCTGQTAMYPEYIKGADIVSFDIYPATSSRANVTGKLELVAQGVQNLRQWVAQSNSGPKVVMNVIGTTNISSTTLATSPEQITSMVWLSLIAGSQGLVYFVHEFAPAFREDGIYNHPANVAAVRDANALITTLAPVLNGPTLDGLIQVFSPGSVATMTKHHSGDLYVFAVEMTGAAGVNAEFVVAGVANATVVDLAESGRSVPFANGRFVDVFGGPGYDAHVYRITPQ